MGEQTKPRTNERAERAEQRLTGPVILAALASIPAVFLTTMDGTAETIGEAINMVSLVIISAETVVLFWLADDKWDWIRRRWWLIAIAVVAILAAVFALGPAQLLRLVRSVGALRVMRVSRIFKAGKILHTKMGLSGPVKTGLVVLLTLLAAAFVGVVLTDPLSESRQFAEQVLDVVGPAGVVAAGAILAAATWVALRYNGRSSDTD